MTLAVLLALPWVAMLLFVRFVVRLPGPLPVGGGDPPPGGWPTVSVVVPARNEEHNIGRCLESLAASSYPAFEIVVVDDRSDDRTHEVARAVPPGGASRIHVVAGTALPEGWLGKPWACLQGAREAGGDVLLFTDADTVHEPDLLERAIRGLREEEADLLTLVGSQIMDTFWERLVQPHVFLGMLFRFPDFERVAANDRWRDAIANGQFIMMPRASYDRLGGHEAVRDEVVEDLALAQHVKRAGMQLGSGARRTRSPPACTGRWASSSPGGRRTS
jgi:chlorobactene glucosyltransferase